MLQGELEHIDKLPRAFLDALAVGISLVEVKDGRIVFANKECARIIGYSQQELAERPVTFPEITHPDDRERNLLEHRRMLAGEIEQYRLQKRYLRRDGSIVWVKITVKALRDRSGTVRWCCGVLEDISDRLKVEQQLALAQQVSGLTTWIFAAKTNSSETSNGYNSVFGLPDSVPAPSLDDFIGRVHPQDRKAVQKTIRQALATGIGYVHEYRIVQPTGEVRWLRGMANCVHDASGSVASLVGATIDITDSRNKVLQKAPKQIGAMLAYIEKNWNRTLSVDELARQARCSSRQIHRYFAAEGISAAAYIKKVRLRHARQFLSNPDRNTTVIEVALACCFENAGHFARDYKKEFGELPSETLRLGRGNQR